MNFSIVKIIMTVLFLCCYAEQQPIPKGMILVPKGMALLDAFYMDKTPVTVKAYRKFVRATAYRTTAERLGTAGVYDFSTQEWKLKKGAYWKYPLGRELPKAFANHPVTQVSWEDACAYCQWAKKRLPTQLEWEHAARNAKNGDQLYPWGNDLIVNGRYQANCWQGTFPKLNLITDGFRFTSPVGYYGKSILGLSDLAGNVWEWTTDDIFVDGELEKVQKGGSFMCEKSVCHGYQITGKTSASPSSALFHVGFRCVQVAN